MKKIISGLSLLCAIASPFSAAAPLSVSNGNYLLNGKPFYGVGVNYYDAFTRTAQSSKDLSYINGFAQLKKYNVPFIRINAIGHWPIDIKANYLNNKPAYYAKLDAFMAEAARQNIGVILSVFWNWAAFADINNERPSAWGDTNSATRKMMRQITTEMVTRYKSSPALWGWEFANESSALMDLPTSVGNYQWLATYSGAPKRTTADNFTRAQIQDALTDFSRTVRINDPVVPIFSGNDVPRANAYHLPKSWDMDTPAQFGEVLTRDNARTDTMSMHLYPKSETALFPGGAHSYSDILAAAMARSKVKNANGSFVDNRPMFLGEFGVSDKDTSIVNPKTKFKEITDAIIKNRVPMSALWVFSLSNQEGTYNVTPTNSRAYQLDTIKSMNATMKLWK